jgi:hypothetical protein
MVGLMLALRSMCSPYRFFYFSTCAPIVDRVGNPLWFLVHFERSRGLAFLARLRLFTIYGYINSLKSLNVLVGLY